MAELHTTNGRLGTEIADAAGEFHDYGLARADPRTYLVTRKDSNKTYTVALCGKTWTCSCPAFEFRNSRSRVHLRGTCKHCVTVAEIDQILRAIEQGASA